MIRVAFVVLALLIASPASAQTANDDTAAFDRGLDAYFNGDPESAWFFWLGPAERGHPGAQFSLGNLYRQGEGVPADPVIAAQWFARAAAAGHAHARLNYALMLDAGLGVARNSVAAYILAIRAAQTMEGDDRRQAREIAATIARRLTPDEAERARRQLMEESGPRRP
jgi:TPR repeat protein